MQTIKRDIYVTKNVLQAPIEVTEGTNSIALEFDIKDYTIPGTAAAVVYSMCTRTMAEPNKAWQKWMEIRLRLFLLSHFFMQGRMLCRSE